MFLLLIFFIMTTTLARTTGFFTDVPKGVKGQQNTQDKTTSVVLHDEKISVDDADMNMDDLRRKLMSLNLGQRRGDDRIVMVEAVGSVPYQRYFETMAAIQSASGIVAIVTEENEGK
jgi:biopolymer transport protein ExbD